MHTDSRSILMQILTIIDFRENKKQFVDRFINLCLQQTFVELLDTAPVEVKSELNKIIQQPDKQKSVDFLLKYFKPDQFNQKLQKVTSELFRDYITSITPTLTTNKQKQLSFYIASLSTESTQKII